MAPETETFDAELAELGTPDTPGGEAVDQPIEGRLGRFVLLEVLGRGGMGVVYTAYDPELDRKVALKLVRRERDSEDARERMVREARGLARVAHPNVVTVHEVGVLAGRVFVVMELLAGTTLRDWLAGGELETAAIVDAYADAARGLAAAHAAGLVHRDFKPSNAIRGEDGRVRVIDFGLVTAADDDGGKVMGTPRYMAPEQAAGEAVTAAADQYSLCVALAEALEGRALPRHLEAALARGRSDDPEARFPSMDALVAELDRRPSQRLRRAALAVAMVGVTGAAITYGVTRGAAGPSCDGGRPAMAALWTPAAREAARAAVPAADWDLVGPRVDAYADDWAGARRAACLAHDRGEQSDTLYDKRAECLDRRRRELGRTIQLLAEPDADPVRAVASLAPIDECSDTERLLARAPLPRDPAERERVVAIQSRLDHNHATENAGLYSVAIAEAADIAREAERIGYAPLVAEASLQQGRSALLSNDAPAAVEPLRRSLRAAITAGEDRLALESIARYVFVASSVGRYHDAAEVEHDADIGRALASRAGDDGALAALLDNNVGSAYLNLGDRDQARAHFESALRVRPSADGVELAVVPANLALTVADAGHRRALLSQSVDELTALLGPDHALTLAVRLRAADNEDDAGRARDLLAGVVDTYRVRYPGQSAARARALYDLAWLDADTGARDAAIARLDEAATLFAAAGRRHSELRARAYAALWRGDATAAAGDFATVARELADDGGRWWIALKRADAELGLGLAELEAGRRRQARAALEASLHTFEEQAEAHPGAAHQRRLARARAALDRAR